MRPRCALLCTRLRVSCLRAQARVFGGINFGKYIKSLPTRQIKIPAKVSGYIRGDGAGPAGTAAAGPMLEAKLMNLINGRLQKF